MSKQLPDTREEAFAYQFEDDVKILHQMAAIKSKESFRKHLAVLQAHIEKLHKTKKKEWAISSRGTKHEWFVYEAYVSSDYLLFPFSPNLFTH